LLSVLPLLQLIAYGNAHYIHAEHNDMIDCHSAQRVVGYC